MGWLMPVTPRKLSRKHSRHPWTFAVYTEMSSDRPDYNAFLFRDSERSIYGIREYHGDEKPHHDKLRDLATKVVTDKEFRKQLISDDPGLPELWQGR
ncbi:MAG: hypothetical protein JXQ73_27155 [Phycisphaerae bacterium]|nr:hypothetical protein [Phycisphaerae bacterium]